MYFCLMKRPIAAVFAYEERDLSFDCFGNEASISFRAVNTVEHPHIQVEWPLMFFPGIAMVSVRPIGFQSAIEPTSQRLRCGTDINDAQPVFNDVNF